MKKTEQVWRYDVEKDQLEELAIGDGQSQISSVYEYGDRLYYVKNKQEYNETTYPITITVHAMSDGKEQELQRFTTWERYRSPILVGEKEHCYLWLAAITQPLRENGEASEKDYCIAAKTIIYNRYMKRKSCLQRIVLPQKAVCS